MFADFRIFVKMKILEVKIIIFKSLPCFQMTKEQKLHKEALLQMSFHGRRNASSLVESKDFRSKMN